MKDVEALHDELAGKARQAGVFNGEGPGACVDTAAQHVAPAHTSRLRRPPRRPTTRRPPLDPFLKPSRADFDMKEVEAFHEAHKPPTAAGPDPSQYNGEGPGE